MAFCKLCEQDKQLHRSHIIPEFMYKAMYDEGNRFHCISSIPGKPNTKKQKGEWEWLLCGDCEAKLSRLERYASLLLKGGIEIRIREHNGAIEVSDIDYKTFKLFQLSILWRASISSRPMFSEVKLGRHENIIRSMLLNEDPGASSQYGCIMIATMHEGIHIDSLILEPELKKVDGQITYRFVFGGFWWLYFCSSHKPPKKIQSVFLNESGVAYIFRKELEGVQNSVSTESSSEADVLIQSAREVYRRGCSKLCVNRVIIRG